MAFPMFRPNWRSDGKPLHKEVLMNHKSLILSALMFVVDFFSALFKELKKRNVTEDQIFDAMKSKSNLIPQMAERIAELIVSVKNELLSLISEGKELVISPVDGTSLLSKASDVFSWIDKDFTNWELNTQGPATSATPVQVFEMSKNGTFKDLFLSLSPNLESLCLTQAQIKEFCKTQRSWLRTDGYGTFLLFKKGEDFFVADVGVYSDGALGVSVRRFGNSDVWDAGPRRRVVVPQLAGAL